MTTRDRDYQTMMSALAEATRRRDAEQEETDLSYLRRLLQGRIDILRSEQARRAAEQQERQGQQFSARFNHTTERGGFRKQHNIAYHLEGEHEPTPVEESGMSFPASGWGSCGREPAKMVAFS